MAAAASVPEPVLVRDVLGACSALQNGRILSFHDDRDGGRWACSATAGVPDTQQQLVSKAAELGWLLRQVELLTAELTTLHSVGHEALVAAARREVANHHRLVAILEAHAQQQAAGTATASAENTLTLRRLQVWLCEPLGRLRVLTMCLELARDVRGGQLINSLHALSKHGDPLVRKVVVPVLEDVCVPFFKQISMWVVSGTVDAASREFLVAKEQLAPPYCDEPAAVWRGGYSLNAAMQPNFLPAQLAADIFTAGKTIAFLREWCGDTRWADAVSEAAKQLATSGGTYQQLRWLETTVAEVKRTVSSHLLDIVMQRHGLLHHLSAIKRFLLLGQGDFVRVLLDSAQLELDKGAKDVSQYTLQGYLDAALRSSSAASEDADILRRVDVRLPSKPLEGDLGWDTFTLHYQVDGPVGAVLSPDAMAGYLCIFRLLWAIKHVEVVLEQCWGTINTTHRLLNTLKAQERTHGVAVDNAELVPPVLRAFHAYRAEMSSFVTSLQYYIVFEVLEPNWARLMQSLPKAVDLNDAISLHEGTLQAIASGMFLDGLPKTLTPLGVGGAGAPDVQAGLRKTLRAMLDIQGPVRRLAATIEQAVVEQALYVQRAEDSEAAGQWNAEVYNSPAIAEDVLREVSDGMNRVHACFDHSLRTFLTLLPAQSHLDLRMFMARIEQAGADAETATAQGI